MYKKWMSCIIFCSVLIVTGCSDNPKVNLVDTLSNGESFQFRGLAWLITDDELMKQENINKDDIEIRPMPPLTFKYVHPIAFEEVDLNVDFILYNFNDEPTMFVSGQYLATFEDKEEYLVTVEKVKSELEAEFDHFNQYFGNSFDPMENFSTIRWEAEDTSSLTLEVFDNTGPAPYTINIKVNAPS